MLWLFIVLAVLVFTIVLIFGIAFVVYKAKLVDKSTFEHFSHISTIVGVPLAVIAVIVAIAGLMLRDKPSPQASPSPTATVDMTRNSSRPVPSVSIFPTPAPTSTATAPTLPTAPIVITTPQGQQEGVAAERRPSTTSQGATSTGPQSHYDRGDIGIKKENGHYELTLENAKTSPTCTSGSARVSNQEKLINVTFTIRAADLDVPSIPTSQDVNTYYIEDTEGRRYQMSCGDGRYFNVSLNSFEGKPKPKTLTVSFVVPIAAQELRFRFNPPAGGAIVLTLPNPL